MSAIFHVGDRVLVTSGDYSGCEFEIISIGENVFGASLYIPSREDLPDIQIGRGFLAQNLSLIEDDFDSKTMFTDDMFDQLIL